MNYYKNISTLNLSKIRSEGMFAGVGIICLVFKSKDAKIILRNELEKYV